jgi:hypothetical protein
MQNSLNQSPEVTPASQPSSNRKWIFIAVVIVLALFLFRMVFSPENIAERVIEQATNGEYDVDFDGDGSMQVTGSEGENVNIRTGNRATLPENWPSSVPLLPDAKIQYSAVVDEQDGGSSVTVTYETSQAVSEVIEYYKDELTTEGWNIDATIQAGDGSMLSASNDNDEGVVINIGPSDGSTTVIISMQISE